MALPGFRPTVQLSEDPPRLTDKTSGRTLTLSRGEAKLLSLYDGVKTHDQLAKAAQDAGFPVDSSHVAGLLERVAHAGFMSEPPPASLSTLPEIEHSSDIVPSLRPDLTIAKSAKSQGLLEVTDPVRGQTFSLYDFEVSIARMLNGRRTAAQIIDAAAKIGIPVSLESLRKFVKQLRAYRFVLEAPVQQMVQAGGTWSPRSAWKPEVRELFQSALRKFRAGKLLEATDYIVALLQIDPENGEARDLQQRINGKLDEAQESNDFTFDELHGGADAAPDWVESEPLQAGAVATGAAPEHLPSSVTGAPFQSASSRLDPVPETHPARASSSSGLPPVPGALAPPPARTASSSAFAPPPPARTTSSSAFGPLPQASDGRPFAPSPPAPARAGAGPLGSEEDGFALAAPPSFSGASPEVDAPLPADISPPPRTFTPAAGSSNTWPVPSAPVRATSLPEVPLSPLGDGAVSSSEVRRRLFDKSGAELTDAPVAPDVGEPLELAPSRAHPGEGGFDPEPIHLERTTTGERPQVSFDPPKLDLQALGNAFEADDSSAAGEPLLPPSASDAAASKAEGVWAPPRRNKPPRKVRGGERPPKKGGRGLLIVGLLGLAAAGGAAAFPVPVKGQAMCALVELDGAPATAPSDLTLKAILVKDGDLVEKGKPLATLDTSEIDARIQAANEKQAELEAQLSALDLSVKPKRKAKAELAVAKALKPLTKLEASDKRLTEQRAKFELPENKLRARKAIAAITRKLKDNEKARLKAQKNLEAAQRGLARVTRDDLRKPITDELEALKTKREAARDELQAAGAISAPASGVWRASDVKDGDPLKSGQVFGSIVSTEKIRLTSKAEGSTATLVAGLVRKQVTIDNGTALLDNADGALRPGNCRLEIDGGKQPLYKRLLKQD